VIALAGVPGTAFGQIYAWRDASGTLVLSDRPAPGAVAYGGSPRVANPVATSGAAIRATRPVARGRRADAYDGIIHDHATAEGISPDLVRAVIQVESAFNPRAVSHKGAMGLMQLMPATATEFGVADPFDPQENIGAGVKYLKRLLARYDNDLELALAAYNAGPGAVDRYGQKVPPYRETRDYLRKVKSVTPIAVGPKKVIYKIVEIIDGREVPRYSDRKPSVEHEIVTAR